MTGCKQVDLIPTEIVKVHEKTSSIDRLPEKGR